MRFGRRRIAFWAPLMALMSLSACRNQASSPSRSSPLLINVAGSTLAYPIYSRWFGDFHQLHPEVEFNYASIGSGGGIAQLRAGTVDLGASDMPLNDQLLSTFSMPIFQFPVALGAVALTYNVPGVTESLNFTPQALAGIFLGTITQWDDPAITGVNRGIELPARKIITIHRSDGSGTTYVLTQYLSQVSKQWKSRVGSNTAVHWPAGLGGKGSEGVAGLIEQTPYSFGYVELAYALENGMRYGRVRNSAGVFIKAGISSATAAALADSAELEKDIRAPITNAPGKDAYPISAFTYLLVPSRVPNAAKRTAIKQFLRWMLADGQKTLAQISFAPLPQNLVKSELKQAGEIQ